MPTGTGVVGTAYRYFFSLRTGSGAPRTGAAASVSPTVRNPGNTASDTPAVTEVGGGQYFVDISAAFTTTHGAGQYGVLLEVTTPPRDTFSESVTYDTIGPSGIPGAVWDELTAAHVVVGSFGQAVGVTIQTRTTEIWQIHGLDSSAPLTVTDTSRAAGPISQTITDDGTTTTVTR